MTDQPLNDPQDSSIVEPAEGVGRRLRAARLERDLSLERVATQLHLKPGLVDALENGRYTELPGPVFVLGYIRNYARQLGLDPEPLLAAYRAATGQPQPPGPRVPLAPTRVGSSGRTGRVLVRLMTVAVVVGLAYLFGQWWQHRAPGLPDIVAGSGAGQEAEPFAQDQAPDDRSADQPEAEVDRSTVGQPPSADAVAVAVAVADPAPASKPGAPAQDVVQPSEPEPAATATDLAAADLAAAPAPSEAPAEPADVAAALPTAGEETGADGDQARDEVVLEFHGPCWVDVRDAAKTFSLTGSMAKGDRRVLGGTPPYSLVLGSSKAVTVTVKGVPFDLDPVSKGNVARFKLDPAALP